MNLTLPAGTRLPVSLAFDLPVQQDATVSLAVPVDLKVRAVIPLSQTQLHDPVDNLRLLFEPLVRALGNLPDDFSQVGPFVSQILSGNAPNLLAETRLTARILGRAIQQLLVPTMISPVNKSLPITCRPRRAL